jgi:hypothetical protein
MEVGPKVAAGLPYPRNQAEAAALIRRGIWRGSLAGIAPLEMGMLQGPGAQKKWARDSALSGQQSRGTFAEVAVWAIAKG